MSVVTVPPPHDDLAEVLDASPPGATVACTGPSAATDAVAATAGFVPVRELVELRRPLPLGPDRSGPAAPVRPFRPGHDEAAWLAVNNRAFAWHPEQGGWDADRLAAALAEPWVDLDGFVVHDGPDGLDGFCWTKVHAATAADPALGEIFVVGVDPSTHRRGLGRALVVAGLDHLTATGLGTAMLWVEADNDPARRLYDDLGFGIQTRKRWYRRP